MTSEGKKSPVALILLSSVFTLQCFLVVFLYLGWVDINKSGVEYAASTVMALGSNWDYKELSSRADPQMFAGHPESETAKILDVISLLGKLQSLQACGGESSIEAATSHFVLIGQYQCKATFEKDTAIVTFVFTRSYKDILSFGNIFGHANDNWKILRFNVASNYLAKTAPAPKP